MTTRSVRVPNRLGFHARAAARFVRAATQFESQIDVAKDGRRMDGKSIMGLLLLAAAQGKVLTIRAHGRDEEDAVDTLCQLVESGFGEGRA